MSRSGYSDDVEPDVLNLWRGAVSKAIGGKRGQAFLRDLRAALDKLPEKALVADELEDNGHVCALGSVGRARGIDMASIDSYDADEVATTFGIARAMACEIEYVNDEEGGYDESPESRYARVSKWVDGNLRAEAPADAR